MSAERIRSFSGISVVVPVFNSEATLPELIARLETVLRRTSTRFEAVLVNDGSQDRSFDVICELARQHKWIRCIDLMRNYGQHNALLCGIRAAQFEVIVTMDDDLQHPPEEIPKLLEKLVGGYDVVYGAPQEQRHTFWRNLASRATKMTLQGIMGAETARNVSAFRAFRTCLRDVFADYRSPYVSIDVLLSWGTTSFTAIQVRQDPPQSDESNYTFRGLVNHALDIMTGFSVFPLQAAILLGFAFTFFGFVVLLYVVSNYLVYGSVVPGFAFLASIVSVFSGAQLFALGILGEYLSRMHFRIMEKPPYAIRAWSEKTGANRLNMGSTHAQSGRPVSSEEKKS